MSGVFVPAVVVRRVVSQATYRACRVPLLIMTPCLASQLRICLCVWLLAMRRSMSSRKALRSIRGRGMVNCEGKKDLTKRICRTRQHGHYEIGIIILRWLDRVWWRIRLAGVDFWNLKKVFGQPGLSPTVSFPPHPRTPTRGPRRFELFLDVLQSNIRPSQHTEESNQIRRLVHSSATTLALPPHYHQFISPLVIRALPVLFSTVNLRQTSLQRLNQFRIESLNQ
jgi:hypothetical protein